MAGFGMTDDVLLSVDDTVAKDGSISMATEGPLAMAILGRREAVELIAHLQKVFDLEPIPLKDPK